MQPIIGLTWRMHLIRSPGAMITVVIMPEKPPAADNWATLNSWLGWDLSRFLPKSLPKKLKAKMGATPTRGAAIPENMKKNTSWQMYNHIGCLLSVTSLHELFQSFTAIFRRLKWKAGYKKWKKRCKKHFSRLLNYTVKLSFLWLVETEHVGKKG